MKTHDSTKYILSQLYAVEHHQECTECLQGYDKCWCFISECESLAPTEEEKRCFKNLIN